ncbi:MAG: class D beta-lactamase [Bdellovibrionales bacterium]|nr:class D beta-lactamase [Bdellovibrionales bacterium]
MISNCSRDIGACFFEADAIGTIYLENQEGELLVHNKERAALPLIPASTFKIPNTLIALSEGVTDLDEVFLWDGTHYEFEAHNQNHTLATAYKASCVWVYQILAKRIGAQAYRKHLAAMKYGNGLLGPDIARFWLDGDLRISAKEQVSFLKKLYTEDLPYPSHALSTLKDIMLEEKSASYQLYSKTGYSVGTDGQHGWYVGWMVSLDQRWVFALNIEMHGICDLNKRKEIAMSLFNGLGVFG